MKETITMKPKWRVTKYADDEAYKNNLPFAIDEFDGNLLLNEGIGELLLLLTGGSATAYSNSNAYLGVGNSTTAASASQTGLVGGSTEFQPMESGYPSISGQTVTFRSIFTSSEANFDWNEFTVVNASSDSGDNLNRKVEDEGTKASGQTWTLDLEITFS